MPAPVFAEVNTTGIRWPSRSARSSGSCSSSGRDLALLQVLLHQLLVDLDHLVDELAVRFLHRGEIGLARRREEAVRDPGAPARGQVERQAFLAERFLDAPEQVLEVHVVGVDLVDDDQPVEAALRRRLHEAPGHHLDAVLRVDHDGGGLDRRQRGQGVTQEVGVPRRVEQMDFRVLAVEAAHGQLQRVLQLLLERGVIADGSAALDAARSGNRPRLGEQRLGQRGLARPRLSDERDRPDSFDRMWHGSPPR